MIAAQTQRTVATPLRSPVGHGNIGSGTEPGTFTTTDTTLGTAERFGGHGIAAEPTVDYGRLYPGEAPADKYILSRVFNRCRNSLHCLGDFGKLRSGYLRRIGIEALHHRADIFAGMSIFQFDALGGSAYSVTTAIKGFFEKVHEIRHEMEKEHEN